jgi:hypothetical protein
MPEYIKALFCILVMATLVFKFSEAPATLVAMTKDAFVSRRNTWYMITVAGFLSQNVWVFYFISAWLVYRASKKDSNVLALFFFLILAMPEMAVLIPGFAGIEHFISVTYQRMLVWVLLLPAFYNIFFGSKKEKFVWNGADIILMMYLVLNVALQFQYVNFTGWIRYILDLLFDVVVPYFVISRSIKNLEYFKEIVMAFIIGAMIVSLVAIFEFIKQWLLYLSLNDAIGVAGGFGYNGRGGNIRAIASTGQSIVLGYVLTIAISTYAFLVRSIRNKFLYVAGFILLIAGEISPLSKGPWVGCMVALITNALMGPRAILSLAKLMLSVIPVATILLFTDYGDKIISYLPFIGNLDEGSMSYRQLLLDRSLDVISNNIYFGSYDYWLYLEDLRQGEGIIDIVNNYIGVALNSGLVGLFLYLLFFVCVFWQMIFKMFKMTLISEERMMGRVLFSTLIAIMVMMSAVSDILNVPLLCWGTAAMGVAYSRMAFASNLKIQGKKLEIQ